MGAELARLDPLWHSLRGLLLEEGAAGQAFAPALHREGTVAEVRQDPVRDAAVVVEEVALRDAVVREEHPVGAAQLHACGRLGGHRSSPITGMILPQALGSLSRRNVLGRTLGA